jgi:hypothetical protein
MGVISVDGDRVLSTGREVRGQQELAGTAAMIMGESRARPAAWWGMRVAATAPERYRLEVLRRRTSLLAFEYPIRRILRSTSEPRWFVPEDNAAIVSAVDRMDHALRTRVADERTTALLALVHACELHRAYFKDRSRRERERQIRALWTGTGSGGQRSGASRQSTPPPGSAASQEIPSTVPGAEVRQMQLEIMLDGPGDTLDALADLARRMAAAHVAETVTPPQGVATSDSLRIGVPPTAVAEVFNVITRFVVSRSDELAVIVRDADRTGPEARIDRRVATNPLELLALLVLFNPPVGLG